jgi:sarcosine oxidase subunit alpha
VAEKLAQIGIDVAAVVDTRRTNGLGGPSNGPWPVLTSRIILRAEGNAQLEAVHVAQLGHGGTIEESSEQRIDCDLLCVASTLMPANELLLQGGARFQQKDGSWLQTRQVAGLSAAGAAAGTFELGSQILEGRLRGAEAAAAVGRPVPELDDLRHHWNSWLATPVPQPSGSVLTQASPRDRKRFVCLCEDVTEKDLEQAVAEGFDGIETLKRYSTVTMGPCQGKVCQQASIEVCARLTGRDVCAIGTTTSRPPAVPVELGVMAADRHHAVRRTPLHHWHLAHDARWLDAGLWKRPESYGDQASEVNTVRKGVGLIDVSTLGKIEVSGPDAVELLERVYLNKWQDLKPGRTRYGVMCNEDGIVFDDGVGARLGPDRFYLTATTGNAEGVVQWLELWKATWRLNATIIDYTSALAAMNLAGPRARAVLGRVTGIDLSPVAFPYLAFREGEVAGVPCRLMRIGFVGELGYEIHCPAGLAWHLWEALCQAGAEFGQKPFGVEAQRILRLEKGHLIVGQDTDALSNPLEAGLEWLVRFEKPSFIGREPLLRLKEMGPRSRLVGFEIVGQRVVPGEGSQVVEGKRSMGRVTSARYSPTLAKSLGLAWAPAANSAVGQRFTIRWNGTDVPAMVASLPFYDPEGRRMKQ